MRYLVSYALLLTTGILFLARWFNPSTVGVEVIAMVLIVGLGIKVISLYDRE